MKNTNQKKEQIIRELLRDLKGNPKALETVVQRLLLLSK